MSMIKCFFEKTVENNKHLFNGLNIENEERIMEMQGKYPVIYITLKDLKDSNFEKFIDKIYSIISEEFGRHRYLLDSDVIQEEEKTKFKDILFSRATQGDYELSLKYLSRYLSKYHNQKVILLIDEYDVPIQAGFVNGYYEKIIEFMRNFLSGGLKDNECIERAMISGILRISKESIFSGLNNLEVASIAGYNFSNKFGFTEEEVTQLLNYYEIKEDLEKVKTWYNGYMFGNETIYNPWSILNYTAKDLEILIEDGEIVKKINEDIVMGEINESNEKLWKKQQKKP